MDFPAAELRRRRKGIALTYGLSAAENLLALLYPFAIGLAINGLMVDQWLQLAPLAFIWSLHTGIGYVRQRFDTRLFTRIYTTIAAGATIAGRRCGAPVSEVAARTDMAEELVEFLEHDLPAAAVAVIGLLGGLIMLSLYDGFAALIMACLLPPLVWTYWRFAQAAQAMESRFNNRSEQEVSIITHGSPDAVWRHFRHLSKWRVRISDAEARSWSSLEIVALLLFMAALYRLAQVPGLMSGDIFAAIAYAVRMLDSADLLPDSVASISRIRDNLGRLRY